MSNITGAAADKNPLTHSPTRLRKPAQRVSRKDEYRAFCDGEASLPLFSRGWWLDAAVGPEGWDVALAKRNGSIVASMPYVLRSRFGLKLLTQPALTPILGPWLRNTESKHARQSSWQEELMQELIDQLPEFDHFTQTWHSNLTNWQTFFWNGFQQTTYYTYILTDLSDVQKVWDGVDSKARRNIMKAQTDYQLSVRDDLSIDVLLKLNRMTFERQGLSPPYPDEFVRRLDAVCTERGCRKMLFVVDPGGKPLSGYYFVWDEHSAYGLISGADPGFRRTGANSLCLWHTIKHAATVTRQYNFCGSMIRPVEAYLRTFGGKQVPYSCISKTPSRILSVRQTTMKLIGKR